MDKDEERDWSSELGGSGESSGESEEEDDEQEGHWESKGQIPKSKESFIVETAESVHADESVHAEKMHAEKEVPKSTSDSNINKEKEFFSSQNKASGSRSGQNTQIGNDTDSRTIGLEEDKMSPIGRRAQLNDVENNQNRPVKEINLDSSPSIGNLSSKMKVLLSRQVPIAEKLEMLEKDLSNTQRKARVNVGRVYQPEIMERRVTRSQSKMGRKKATVREDLLGEKSDSSVSIEILHRLDEIGEKCGIITGEAKDKAAKSKTGRGEINGKS
ncbi:hypothetical protein LXL04_035426 [Taraxacum kok-saghyz]